MGGQTGPPSRRLDGSAREGGCRLLRLLVVLAFGFELVAAAKSPAYAEKLRPGPETRTTGTGLVVRFLLGRAHVALS